MKPSSRRLGVESGQVLVINVLFLAVMIGFLGLVVDGGAAFVQRRNLQGVADSSALAGAMDVSRSAAVADATARAYVLVNNSQDGAKIRTIVTTGSNTSTCAGKMVPRYSVCVSVDRNDPSFFAQIVGIDSITTGAVSIASASQVYGLGKWLPIGLMDGAWDSGRQIDFEPGSSSAPAGTINPDAGDGCKFSGGDTIRDVAVSKQFGGIDACELPIGSTIPKQTGGTNGPVLQGIGTRVGTNSDSFDDVFEWNPDTRRYIVKKPDSPRLGIVPIAEGGQVWTTTSGANMTVVGYGLVYLGDQTKSGYPPVTGKGTRQQIHFTPVDAVLPPTWDIKLSSYDPLNRSPIVYRLVS